jgi:hypothetical protein
MEAMVAPEVKLTRHLTWAEATITQHRRFLAEQGNPPAKVRLNLRRSAADLFEPARALLGPLLVSSGYRCPALNRVIGGSRTSRHMEGLAFDVVPLELDLRDAMQRLVESAVPFDQLIYEFGRWLHIGGARHGEKPRGQRLMIFALHQYEVWNPGDPRFRGVA